MPTELIIPIPTETLAVPPGMVINPWLDWSPFLGLPIHLFITVICILFFLGVIIYWIVRLGKLASVNGWIESAKKMTPDDVQVWIITRIQRLFIVCMTIKDNVLSSHDPLNIAMWHVNSPMGIVRVGGQTAVIVSEDFDRNRDFITEIALCENLDHFNDNQQALRDEVDEKYQEALVVNPEVEKPRVIKPIIGFLSYEEYGRKCLETLNPDGVKIPPYNIFNPNRFRKYFPKGCSGVLFGGELITEARDWNIDKKEKSFWEIHAFLFMAMGIGLIAIMAAWLFPLSG